MRFRFDLRRNYYGRKRKTVTSTEVKRRYNQKVYSQISFSAPKELVEEFRGICRNIGISQASVFKSLSPILLKSTDKIKTTR